MDALLIASDKADAQAAEAVEQHHSELAGALALKVESLAAAARDSRTLDEEALADLVGWCRTELVPHALAEESTLYRAAAERIEGRLLVEAMLSEHQVILGLVDGLEQAADPVAAAVTAGALRAVFDTHLSKENRQVLPLLVAAAEVSVATLLAGMHTLIGGGAADGPQHGHDHESPAPAGHACGCHDADQGTPELDARAIPHAIRHATIFGALEALSSGDGLVLIAPHDPLPLLAQLEQRAPGAFAVDYLERGPEAWRLSMVRTERLRSNA